MYAPRYRSTGLKSGPTSGAAANRRHRQPRGGIWGNHPGTGSVFGLTALVSAEADPDLGYRVNLDGTRAVLDACRTLGTCPRLVFASSLAVYGGDLAPAVGEGE